MGRLIAKQSDWRNAMTRSMISSVVSRTMYFCPDVSVITVSGVISMCSIRSEFTIIGVWLSLVILIMGLHILPSRIPHIAYRRKSGIVYAYLRTELRASCRLKDPS